VKPKCPYGNHRWDKGSKEGSLCLDCHKEYGVRRFWKQPPAEPAAPKPVAPDGYTPPPATATPKPINENLRAKWGLNQTAQPAQPAQPAQAALPKEEKPDADKVDVGQLVREGIPELVISAEQKLIRKVGNRIPNDPDDKLKGKFDESFEKWCRGKGMRIEVSPGLAMLGLSVALLLQMYIGAEEMPPPRARAKDSASGTGEKPASTPYQQSSPQTPALSLVEDSGAVSGADVNASDE
jgi:hypothetical protein